VLLLLVSAGQRELNTTGALHCLTFDSCCQLGTPKQLLLLLLLLRCTSVMVDAAAAAVYTSDG
jgi:hypothetical protein